MTGRVVVVRSESYARCWTPCFLTTMFSRAVQPGLVSLFSSTSSNPLSLFSTHSDSALPSDSFVCLLHDTTSTPVPTHPRMLVAVREKDEDYPDYTLDQTVLHIQSPTLQTTCIRSSPAGWRAGDSAARRTGGSSEHLGLKHPWLHLQVRSMDREWAFEVGIVDQAGREGVVRCATFQV